MKKLTFTLSILLLFSRLCQGQDPAFSQFFSSPLNINPALTGNINGDWRFITNIRDQWIGPASPYTSGSASFDTKVLQHKMPGVTEEKDLKAVGGMLLYDYAMSGVVKSVYGSLNLSYSKLLSETERARQRLAIGFGATYGRRHVDFSRVDFEEQFTGFGFNTNLPTGESALSNMKPHLSINTGLVYSYTTERSNWDIGVAAFHVNEPRQTFLKDPHQELALRKVAHLNFETFLSDGVVLNANAIYQYQIRANYLSVGGALGYYVGGQQNTLLTAGVWYWSKNALVPYLGLSYGDLQFGVSYDLTTSKLRQADRKPNTYEVSLIIRGVKGPTNTIPCPWK
jgi:type IX secretion system PorP/SprF family membrane protein